MDIVKLLLEAGASPSLHTLRGQSAYEIAKNKDRLPQGQLKPVKETLTPLQFGKRRDPKAGK